MIRRVLWSSIMILTTIGVLFLFLNGIPVKDAYYQDSSTIVAKPPKNLLTSNPS